MKKMKLRALVVDDEKSDRDLLSYLLKSHPGIEEVHVANSAEEGLFQFIDINPDIVFLDIVMPGKSGIDFINLIKKRNLETNLIITSAHREAAIEAIKKQVFDFILKPINEQKLFELIDKYQDQKHENINQKLDKVLNNIDSSFKIKISSRNSHLVVEPAKIVYCTAEGAYTDIHLSNGTIELANANLSKIETLLQDFRFFRIGRSTLINLDYLWKVNRSENTCTLLANDNEVKLRGSAKLIKALCQTN